jgi:DNA-binding MarR family transcriptional regulator
MSRENRETLRARLGETVRALQASVDALDEAVAEYLGVNRTDLRCLDILLQLGATTPGQLAARLGLTTGSVTAMLDRLERLGYLARSPDPDDRRKLVVRPTAEAGRVAGEIYGPLAEAGARSVAGYTVAELELLVDFVRRSTVLQEEHLARIRALPVRRPRRPGRLRT